MFAVLHVTDFSLQAVLRIERDLAGKAVALLDDSQRPPLVVACTAPAAAHGVGAGLTSPQAMARCPAVSLRTRQPDAEAEAKAGLCAAAFSVSPQVEDTAPGVGTIFVGGLSEEKRIPALRSALAQLREMGLTATASLAETPLLALYAAQQAQALTESDGGPRGPALPRTPPPAISAAGRDRPLVEGGARPLGAPKPSTNPHRFDDATVATLPGFDEAPAAETAAGQPDAASYGGDQSEPRRNQLKRTRSWMAHDAAPRAEHASSGRLQNSAAADERLGIFKIDDRRAFLSALPLAVAEPSPEVAAILASWGVRTLGELTALSKGDVTLRLGPAGLALWERAAGEVTRPLRLITTPATFSAELQLEQEIETLEPLLFVLQRFIDRLSLDLGNAGFVAGEMILRLRLADETEYTRAFRLPEPTARPEILFRVLQTHLETLHTEAMIGGLALTCRPVRPLAQQSGLFDSALRDPHGFAETLARVAAVVGPDRLGTPVVENTHRPDAVRLVAPASVVPPMAKEAVHAARGLPLRRYREPLTATVELVGDHGRVPTGLAPAFVWTHAIAGAVNAVAGPWRGSSDWWDGSRGWSREEWDVELETGGIFRLLHVPEGWFVEGEYD